MMRQKFVVAIAQTIRILTLLPTLFAFAIHEESAQKWSSNFEPVIIPSVANNDAQIETEHGQPVSHYQIKEKTGKFLENSHHASLNERHENEETTEEPTAEPVSQKGYRNYLRTHLAKRFKKITVLKTHRHTPPPIKI